jgi:hypothetical protein
MIKKKKLLKLGCFLYGLKVQLILIDCDKLLFLKKYKNMWNLIKISLYDKRIYFLIYRLLEHRVRHICWL